MLSFNFTRIPKDKIGFSQSTNTSQGEARGDKVSSLHCVHFREKLEQKRFSAKLRIEPGTIRLPTVGCFNHSATGLVGK